ncbi:hypothetical protein ETD86_08115 [Nonomuraea turkmeniaca]|uniref:Transposase IS4 N-terminal domain-containing protein n=1 Tax=Nonomuraea turkmeniaca TaxID=103838 RepID=A0A5S4FRP9_9ACTN|nr:hypothetical protein ETD86_08115 [Nonomuraea turkmeniaca]
MSGWGANPSACHRLVWQKLTASLTALPIVAPTAKALRDLRRRVGSAPMRSLFEVLCGPLAQPRTPGVRFGPYRTVSFDGCSSLKAPDTVHNRAWLGSPRTFGGPGTAFRPLRAEVDSGLDEGALTLLAACRTWQSAPATAVDRGRWRATESAAAAPSAGADLVRRSPRAPRRGRLPSCCDWPRQEPRPAQPPPAPP